MFARVVGATIFAFTLAGATSAAPAMRIVSLAPHATELVAAAGGADRLVGVTQSCDYPARVAALAQVSGSAGVNIEKLLSLKPDLVVAWPGGNRPQDIERLRWLGIPLLLSEPKSIDEIAADITRLGDAMGTAAVAAQSVASLRATQRSLIQNGGAKRETPHRVFYQLGAGQLFTLNDAHPVMELLNLCGGKNVFGHLSPLAPHVSIEAAIEAKPDVIIVASPAAMPEVKQSWERHRAAFGGRLPAFIAVDGNALHRPTPRMLPAAKAMCEALRSAQMR